MFNYKKEDFYYIFIPGFVLFVLAFIGFLVATFYDQAIAEFFEQGMEHKFIKAYVIFYDELGLTQSVLIVYAMVMVILESFYFYVKNNNKIYNFIRKPYWLFLVYIGFTIFWLVYNISNLTSIINKDHGMGPGFDPKLIESNYWRFYARLTLFIIEFGILVFITWFIRVKFSKRTDILIQEYWIDGIKGLTCFLFTGAIVFFIKWSMGRPYYYNTIFERIYAEDIKPLGYKMYSESHPNFVAWGYGEGGLNNAPYLPWYIPNDFTGNLKNWFNPEAYKLTNMWYSRAFPSGHTISTFTLINFMYFFVGQNKGRRLTLWKKLVLASWVIHINLMQFSLNIFRFHWLTDTTFSIMAGLAMFLCVNRLIDKYIFRDIARIDYLFTKKHSNLVFIINSKNKYDLYWQRNNKLVYYKTVNNLEKVKKLEKYFKIEQKT